jgi:hypothetical protein
MAKREIAEWVQKEPVRYFTARRLQPKKDPKKWRPLWKREEGVQDLFTTL